MSLDPTCSFPLFDLTRHHDEPRELSTAMIAKEAEEYIKSIASICAGFPE